MKSLFLTVNESWICPQERDESLPAAVVVIITVVVIISSSYVYNKGHTLLTYVLILHSSEIFGSKTTSTFQLQF